MHAAVQFNGRSREEHMTRRVAAVVVALTIFPAVLYAQDAVLTVTVQSADVYKSPSTAAPVVGHASRGTALPVQRDLGSWVQVPWSASPEGIGYVHMSMGRVNPRTADTPAVSAPSRAPSSAASVSTSPSPSTAAPAAVPLTPPQTSAVPRGQGTTISHIVGVGGMVGTMSSFGATARWWRKNHLGVQVGVTRDSMSSDTSDSRVKSMQIEPGVVYALFDRVRDYVWVRPYVGSALSFRHATLSMPVPDPNQPTSDNGVGFRVFGGGEFTFATATQFGLSAEVGYRRLPTPFPGFEPDRMSVAIVGHWYIK
jgi:hypothetical protein